MKSLCCNVEAFKLNRRLMLTVGLGYTSNIMLMLFANVCKNLPYVGTRVQGKFTAV